MPKLAFAKFSRQGPCAPRKLTRSTLAPAMTVLARMLLTTKSVAIFLALISPVLAGVQTVFKSQAGSGYGYNNLTEVMHLSSIASDEFTALSNPLFPNHQVPLKKSHFCDPTVK
ncbi:hypothetical protein DXG03_006570 [Asterophora parasitica]|uniref:Uncharacterized protein n=1 Tax=Asterophora parasitica TaxID=117018 RepID=A0A9P7KC62_9AGAR|nr:hypothetical protein DXG03_006570 [Asterophora parasitica]